MWILTSFIVLVAAITFRQTCLYDLKVAARKISSTQPNGYFATPSSGSDFPVLVLHAWWGSNVTIKGFCCQLVSAGYFAFASYLYHSKVGAIYMIRIGLVDHLLC
ncbi:hypothetical protein EU528_11980 [Candidatus Thorarchaeota archaeon]|nr:MAG: hypothetical protein EU528_11980 [Candidatus Thorarchaeota archaeon]